MDIAELWERYQRFASADLFNTQNPENLEISLLLWENSWLRIMLTRRTNQQDSTDVDVELALPKDFSQITRDKYVDLIEVLIIHLDYLILLAHSGFSIDMVPDEGLWIASATLAMETGWKQFHLLQPPEY